MPELNEIDMDKLRRDLSYSLTDRILKEFPPNAYRAPDPETMESVIDAMAEIQAHVEAEVVARRDAIHAACVDALARDCGVVVDEVACTASASPMVPAGEMYVVNHHLLAQFQERGSWV